jgi:hypothetical protein
LIVISSMLATGQKDSNRPQLIGRHASSADMKASPL